LCPKDGREFDGDEGCTDMILYFYDLGENHSLDLFDPEVILQLR
jgi:hypothetical protein